MLYFIILLLVFFKRLAQTNANHRTRERRKIELGTTHGNMTGTAQSGAKRIAQPNSGLRIVVGNERFGSQKRRNLDGITNLI